MKNQWQKDILLECYPKDILKMMRDNYGNKKRTGLIKDGFTFEQFTLKLYELGYLNADSHQIRRINTTEQFSADNIYLKTTDGMQRKLKSMSKIINKNKRVALKINEEKPFRKFA
jgi:hypothetical protein